MKQNLINSRIAIHHRYIRSVDMVRDIDHPEALEGYIVTASARDAAIRILEGLSTKSRQRAFRIVGPYGAGKSAFGVFLARLLREKGDGMATSLLSDGMDSPINVTPWRPLIISGRRVSFSRELLRVVIDNCSKETDVHLSDLTAEAESMLNQKTALDSHAITALVAEMATRLRAITGEGLLLLIDEMGLFLEYAVNNIAIEDPSIFQSLAERAGGYADADLAVVGFLHHNFVDYVAGMGKWIESEWIRFSERYEEVSFSSSTEQSLFMMARAIQLTCPHIDAVRQRAVEIYGEATDRGLFAAQREEVVQVAANLYPLHPVVIAALALANRRFGQNERSLFSFLQSLEPHSFKRFIHSTLYDADNWYRAPALFDYLCATIDEVPGRNRTHRWSLAFDALAAAANLSEKHRDVLKTVALVAVLEPLPGLIADADTLAWSLEIDTTRTQEILDDLAKHNLIYRRPHRHDYSLWLNSSVDLSRWLDDARAAVPPPKQLDEIFSVMTPSRPVVAHRHYHATGTLRTFEVLLWNRDDNRKRKTDGLILIVPVYHGENMKEILANALAVVKDDLMVLVCARKVTREDIKWAYELALWRWVRNNCEELKVDELARVEVSERVAEAERAMAQAASLLSSISSTREEAWGYVGNRVNVPAAGLSALLSDICDNTYNRSPILKNELINRSRLSTAVSSARMRLLDRMLTCEDQSELGLQGTPPERTIYLSLFQASGIHAENANGSFAFSEPRPNDPCRWRYVWKRIADQLEDRETISFSTLIDDLAAPPYGVRIAPALLIITVFVLAYRNDIAVMERNSFQPDLTTAHFMRLIKSPGNFALKMIDKDSGQKSVLQGLATKLQVIDKCEPTIFGISERLFKWYNSLPPYTLKTKNLVTPAAVAVREVLRKATEPVSLFFHDLPNACNALKKDGSIEVEHYVETLNEALLEFEEAMPQLKARAIAATLHAFGAKNFQALRSLIQSDYEPHRLDLHDYRLRAFIERAINTEVSQDRWLDGIAGHLTGKRPDNWADDTLDKFDFEIRTVAGNLARWLALARTRQTRSSDLKSIHVVSIDGQEKVIVLRRDRPNPHLERQLVDIRKVLGNDPQAVEVLGQLLAEYSDSSPKLGVDEKMEQA